MNRLFYLAIILTVLSCSKKNADPNKVPTGIQAVIDGYKSCVCEPYIDLYNWHNQEVYVAAVKGPTCNSIPLYYNRKGKQIEMDQDYTLDDFRNDAEFVRNVWSCE